MAEFKFDPKELLKQELVLDKFESAKRQIISAIKMFFYDWDVVSQHTLIGAAHQILYDISKIEGKSLSMKDSPLIKENKKKEFMAAVNKPQNYFKHANKDYKHKLIFRYALVPFYLFDTIRMFILLSGNKLCFEMCIFLMWFQLRYPDLLNYPYIEKDLKKIRADTKDPDTFRILGQHLLEKGKKL